MSRATFYQVAGLAASLLLVAGLAVLAPPAAAASRVEQTLSSTPDWTFESDQADALLGNWVATAGDVNGDGFDDVLASAPSFDNPEVNEGRIYLFQGSAAGLGLAPAWTFESDQAGAGARVAQSAGDVNGDGYGDVVVGVAGYDNGEVDEGLALLFLGSASGLSTTPAWTAEGDQAGAAFGGSVASAGDVNGDGFADIHVGASGYDNPQVDEGRAFVYHGSASGPSLTPDFIAESNQASAVFGRGMTAGDVNGDGFDDLIVGTQGYDSDQLNEGRVYIYKGSPQGLKKKPLAILEFNEAEARFGNQVRTAGDVNGDGFSDVIANLINSPTPRVILYLGSPTGPGSTPDAILQADQPAQFGIDLGTAGDVNGDGFDDVIVGARFYDITVPQTSNEGRVFVYLGSSTGLNTTATQSFDGTQVGEELGIGAQTAGDVNGDGFSDVIIGAHAFDNPENNEGRALVFHGAASMLAAAPSWSSRTARLENTGPRERPRN